MSPDPLIMFGAMMICCPLFAILFNFGRSLERIAQALERANSPENKP